MLQRIKLKNFRRFADASLDFGDGITVINGANGVGKSTVIEAIEWAFYNKTKKETVLTSIRNKYAVDEEVRVTIYFKFDKKEYKLDRILTPKNSTTATLTDAKDEEKIYAKGTTGVNDYITKLFGIGHQAFTTSFIAKQKEIDSLGNFKNEERKQFFIKLLGLQVLDKIKPEVRRDLRGAKETLTLLRGQLPDISLISDEIKTMEAEARELIRKQEKTNKTQIQIKEKFDKAIEIQKKSEDDYRRFLQLTENKKSLEESILKIEKQINENKETIVQLTPYEKEKIDVQEIDALINRLETERDNYRRLTQFEDALRDARQKVKALQNDIDLKNEDKKKLVDKLPEGVHDLNELRNIHIQKNNLLSQIKTQLSMVEEQYKQIEQLLTNIKNGLITQCPTCYSNLDNSSGAVEHVKKEQKNHNKNIMALKFQISELQEEVVRIQNDIQSKQVLKEEYDGLMAKINTITALTASFESNLKEAQTLAETLSGKTKDIDVTKYLFPNLYETEQELKSVKQKRQQLITIIEKINNLRNKREENVKLEVDLTSQKDDLEKVNNDLKKINFNEEKYNKTIADVREITELLDSVKEQIMQQQSNIQILQNDIKNKETEKSKALAIKDQVEEYRNNINVIALVDEIMTSLRLNLANRITPKIGEYTSNFLRDITDGLYQNVILDENYNIKVLVDDEEWPLAQLSGGEQDVINLCMRLAISQIILEAKNVPYNMIILDEIFGSQDDERKLAIIDVIGRLKGIFPQIILITHINEVKDKADTIITVSKDENGNSTAI